MPAYSYTDYARILLCLPGTSEDIAERVGSDKTTVARLMSCLWFLGLCHPGGVRKVKAHSNRTAVWHLGVGDKAEGLRVRKAKRPKAQQIAFASIWRALEDGATARGAAIETGSSHVSLYNVLAVMKEHEWVHVWTWDRDAVGRPVAVWRIGPGKDAPKPRVTKAEKARKYRARLRIRALTMLGAANSERMREAA
jgi:hypothetical protein